MTDIRVELFGDFCVTVDGHAVDAAAWHRRKPAALIKLLALAPGHRLHRAQLIDTLWPELDETAGGANLRKAVFQARRALVGTGTGAADLIQSDTDVVRLKPDGLRIDVDEFRAAVAGGRRDADVAAYRRAAELYRTGLLPGDRFEEWAATHADAIRLEYLAVLEELIGLLEGRGEIGAGIDVAQQLVAAEPLREDNHVTLIRLNALAGRRGEALRAYDRLTEMLLTELRSEPGPAAAQLYEEIRSRNALEPDLAAELWERVGDLRVLSGDADGAAHAYATVLENDNSPDARARLERKCADAWLGRHRPDRAAQYITGALELTREPAELGRLRRTQANHAWETGDIAAAQSFAEQARELALASGGADDIAAAQEALAIVSHFKGEWREGLASELERLALGEVGATELARVFDLHHCIGQYHLYGDGLADSVEGYARRILDRAEEAGAVRAQAFAWCLLGESLLLQARFDEAAGCLERSCELHESLGTRSGALPYQRRAELAICTGDTGEAEPYLRRASAIATVSPMASHVWGRIYATRAFAALQAGAPERAVDAVRAAAASAQRYGDCPSCSALLNPVAAEAFAMVGDAESARRYATQADEVGRMFASSAWQAMAVSAAASVAAVEGNDAAARARFEEAAVLYSKAGQPYWAGWVAQRNAQGTPVA